MRRIAVLIAIAATLAATPAPAQAEADCRFEDGRAYERFGGIRTFTAGSDLYACLSGVGRTYRLDTGTIRARTASTRRAVFGFGDWLAYPLRNAAGERRLRAINLRTGERHRASVAAAVTAVVVNLDGTLAWIAGTELRAKAFNAPQQPLGADPAIDREFLSLERDEGCAVTWLVGGEQRSSSIPCAD